MIVPRDELVKKYGPAVERIFSEKARWMRIAAVGFAFTAASLAQMWIQSNHIIDELKALKELRSVEVNMGVAMQQCFAFNSSISAMWNNIGEKLMDASHFPEEFASNKNFTNWVDSLFQTEYQVHQLRRSSIHQPDPLTTLRLLQIIHNRVEFLKKGEPIIESSPPPLHIVAVGGSVTAGMGCGENNFGLKTPFWSNKNLLCAWSSRLEYMFNHALFEGKEVVKVSNLASGGAASEVGKVVMEYRLFSEDVKKLLPHVVIWAHAANDSQERDKSAVEYNHLPGLVHASRNLRKCDKELPLVVMLDDWYGGDRYTDTLALSSMVYKVSSWYRLMGVSHYNVLKDKLNGNFDNDTLVTHLTGGIWNLHPGMGVHIGAAWTLFFNFLKAFTETCEDGSTLRYGTMGKDNNDAPHTKHLGSYQREETVASLNERWKRDSDTIKKECSERTEGPSEVCTYAWMVNPMTGITNTHHVDQMLKGVLVHNDGWKAAGKPVRQPRTGWYAQKAKAEFSLKIVASLETKYITLMTMKSYGPNFKDTNLRVVLRVASEAGGGEPKVSEHSISGFHEMPTSIHIPHKFELPGGGANKGDTILVGVTLVSGAYFKVNGIALCTF